MTTIVLADDHHIVRQGLRALLEAEPDFKVVGEAGDGLEVAQLAQDLNTDVLVLDLMMPGLNGIEVTRRISKRFPRTSIIMLSMYGNEVYVLEALRAGAKAYVLKESTAEELVRAVHEAVAGRHYLSTTLSERAIESYMKKSEATIRDPYDTLSFREREVLQLAAHGSTNNEIAKKLCISSRTAESHRIRMMHKLNLHTHTDLIRYAFEKGILPSWHTPRISEVTDDNYFLDSTDGQPPVTVPLNTSFN